LTSTSHCLSCVGFRSGSRQALPFRTFSTISARSTFPHQISTLKTSKFLKASFDSTLNRPSVRLKFDFSKKNVEKPDESYFRRRKERQKTSAARNKTTMLYVIGVAVLTTGMSYAAVPLYRMFCQASGYGGTTSKHGDDDGDKLETLKPNKDRRIVVKFQADTAAAMQWNFRPQQTEVTLFAGETALAFYTAKNPTEKPIDGISTYNVIPFEAGSYFNKIQCFCFEEQRLNPGEEVDMPVFFYIDPEFLEDPFLEDCTEIHLSYTFFESKPGLQLPVYH